MATNAVSSNDSKDQAHEPVPEEPKKLSEEERNILEQIYIKHGKELRRIVASELRKQGKAGVDSVLHSTLLSQMIKVPLLDENREIWMDLLGASLQRHCEKHNKRTTRAKKPGRPDGAVPYSALGAQPGTDERGDLSFDFADPSLDPAKAIEDEDWLQSVLKRLSPTQREILRLKLSGHTIDEIAYKLELVPKTVKAMLLRIRARLRDDI